MASRRQTPRHRPIPLTRLTVVVTALLACQGHAASSSGTNLLDLSLDQLMQVKIDTASKHASQWRDQPGIITIFSAEDMAAMGARTLLDVLQRIPGTSLGIDGRNSIGLIMRGNWTLEGKIMVLLNGQPMNELLYGSWSPLPYMPVSQLDRVEVLRGPGSTQYGGSAQLAVIRIFTRQPSGDQPGRADYTAIDQSGQLTQMLGLSQRLATDQLQAVVSASLNRGAWGNEHWTDSLGQRADTADADTHGGTLALSADYRDSDHLQLYHEAYDLDPIQGFGIAQPASTLDLKRTLLSLSHDAELKPQLTLTPRLNYRVDNVRLVAPEELTTFDIGSKSMGGALEFSWEYTPHSSLNGGVDYQRESAQANETQGPYFLAPTERYFGNDDQVDYERRSFYTDWNTSLGDYHLTLGARRSHHQYAGNATTPRLGLTRSSDNWHVKWLYGEAFREPNIETIHYGSRAERLKPERTRVNEIELGHRLFEQGYLTLSLFAQSVQDPIIFSQDTLNALAYNNNATMHTHGAELQYLYRGDGFSLQANYSWTQSNDSDLPVYQAEGPSGQYLGAPAQVANLWLSVNTPIEHLSGQFGARYVGQREATVYDPALTGGLPDTLPLSQQTLQSEFTINTGLRYDFSDGSLSLGIDNLFDRAQQMPQPYAGGSTPFPFNSRALWLRGEWCWQ